MPRRGEGGVEPTPATNSGRGGKEEEDGVRARVGESVFSCSSAQEDDRRSRLPVFSVLDRHRVSRVGGGESSHRQVFLHRHGGSPDSSPH